MAKLGSSGSEFLMALHSRYQGMLESSEGVGELGESASRRVIIQNYLLTDAP